MAATTTHRNAHPGSSSAPRRSTVPLGLITAGILGLVLQVSLPSCSFDLGAMLDANKTCGAQLAENMHKDASSTERILASAACKAQPR